MFRFALAALILTALPLHAEEGSVAKEHCAATKGIVASAVEMRVDGKKAKRVKKSLTKGDGAVDAKYTDTVAPLVDWVFTLDEAQLDQGVAEAYEKQCLAFDQ